MRHSSTFSGSRRSFLKGCGLTLTGFGVASVFPTPLIQHAMGAVVANPASDRRFLFVFLRGGNDGLNTVIPHGDPDYNNLPVDQGGSRPTLYISPSEAIDLNGFASLHPSLADIMDVYNANDLAVIHRVGYPNNSRSHFDGQRIWENGDPTQTQLFEGWLYRYLQENAVAAGVDLPVLTVQNTPPLLIGGDERFVNIANPDNFDYNFSGLKRTKFATGWRERFAQLAGLEPYRPVLSQTSVKLVDVLDEYESWDQQNWDPKDPNTMDSLFPVSNATNPPDPNGPNGMKFSPASYGFFRSLKVAALSLLESADGTSNNGTRIAGTQLGGWDTHNEQGALTGPQAERLSWVAYGFRSLKIVLSGAAFDPDRSYTSIWSKTVVATLSEFGRTSLENGSFGTDHAAASCLFVQGGCVQGGVYNCDPTTWDPAEHPMFGVNNRYLLERTDYRSIFWEILRDHMGASGGSLETVFPGYTAAGLGAQELGLFSGPCAVPFPGEDPIPTESPGETG